MRVAPRTVKDSPPRPGMGWEVFVFPGAFPSGRFSAAREHPRMATATTGSIQRSARSRGARTAFAEPELRIWLARPQRRQNYLPVFREIMADMETPVSASSRSRALARASFSKASKAASGSRVIPSSAPSRSLKSRWARASRGSKRAMRSVSAAYEIRSMCSKTRF